MPSLAPSSEPTSMPTGVCGRDKGLLEIIVEGDAFVDDISWKVQDIFGDTLVSNTDNGHNTTTHVYYIQECISYNSCYTFSIEDSLGNEIQVEDGMLYRGLYSVRLDDEELVSGSNFRRNHTTMFGASCLHNGDTTCTTTNTTTDSMSMFRLELAALGSNITWSLVDGKKQVVQSAGPFGDCNINTLATCLPSEDCYEFVISDNSEEDGDGTCCSYDKGRYTVMFSHLDEMVQNYTGPVVDFQRVYLGTCFDMNFV